MSEKERERERERFYFFLAKSSLLFITFDLFVVILWSYLVKKDKKPKPAISMYFIIFRVFIILRLFFSPFLFSYLRLFLQYYYSSSSSCSFCCFISLNFIILQRFIRLGIGMSSNIIETSITMYVYKL